MISDFILASTETDVKGYNLAFYDESGIPLSYNINSY